MGQALRSAPARDRAAFPYERRRSPVFARGSERGQLHPEVPSRPRDLFVKKQLPSVFAGTTLAVAGYMTHNCDMSVVFEAFHAGFAVEVLSQASGAVPYRNDAGSASAEEVHRVFSVLFHSNFAAVATTGAWIDAVRTGQALPRDKVLASNRRALDAGAQGHDTTACLTAR